MKLLVLAQIPPPLHGQSAMVSLLLQELPPAAPDMEMHHVNLPLSDSGEDIGKWQIQKLLRLKRAVQAAREVISEHGCDTLYYVPAPGKRIALWRDLLILRALRPLVPHIVLHWHASGLGNWLEQRAWAWERRAAHRWLGQADLSIVLGHALEADAQKLQPAKIAIVPNGIVDPMPPSAIPTRSTGHDGQTVRLLFLGAGNAEKGLFRTIAALEELPENFSLTFAGGFDDEDDQTKFDRAQHSLGSRLTHAGFVAGDEKAKLLADHDLLVFPTQYANEAFPLVVVEALAADLPLVVTRWRAIPEMMPSAGVTWVAPPEDGQAVAAAIRQAIASPPPAGALRRHFEKNLTSGHHVQAMANALKRVGS